MTEASSSAQAATVLRLRWSLSSMRRKVWLISGLVVLISLLGLVLSWLDPAIRAPLRPGPVSYTHLTLPTSQYV